MNEDRVNWRPKIPSSKTTDVTNEEERFQNQTLRPIIKMQHDLLIAHFKQYMVSKKCVFDKLSDVDRRDLKEQLEHMQGYFDVISRRVSRQCNNA